VSSRPPKAGAPFPADLGNRLAAATSAALTAETPSDRYATVLDALAYSPVRSQVTPLGIPAEPTDALRAAVTKLASRIPAIASLFGIEPPAAGRGSKTRGRAATKPLPPKPEVAPTPEAPAADDRSEEPVIVLDSSEVEIVETISVVTDGETTVVVDVTEVEITEITEVITAEADVVVVDVIDVETIETTVIESDGSETTVVETHLTETVEMVDISESNTSGNE
jgi:hypothetical protein